MLPLILTATALRVSCASQKVILTHFGCCLINPLQHQSIWKSQLQLEPSVTSEQLVMQRAERSPGFLSGALRCSCTLPSDYSLITDRSLCLLVFWRLEAITKCIHSSHFDSSAVKQNLLEVPRLHTNRDFLMTNVLKLLEISSLQSFISSSLQLLCGVISVSWRKMDVNTLFKLVPLCFYLFVLITVSEDCLRLLMVEGSSARVVVC